MRKETSVLNRQKITGPRLATSRLQTGQLLKLFSRIRNGLSEMMESGESGASTWARTGQTEIGAPDQIVIGFNKCVVRFL